MNINSFTTGFSLELKKFWGFDHVCKEKEFKYGFVSLKVHELGTEKDQFWVFLLLHLSLLSPIRPAYLSLHPVLTTVSDYITAVLCCAAECFIPTAQTKLWFRRCTLSLAQPCPAPPRASSSFPLLRQAHALSPFTQLNQVPNPLSTRTNEETNLSLSIFIFHSQTQISLSNGGLRFFFFAFSFVWWSGYIW